MKWHFVPLAAAVGAAFLSGPTAAFAQSTTCVSVNSSGHFADGPSDSPAISADGRYVVFLSPADDLVESDTNGAPDVFVHDGVTGATERMSVDSSGVQGDDDSLRASISADGRYVVFSSIARNLVPEDTNGFLDVFVHDRSTGATERISVSSSGTEGNDWSGGGSPAISADGRFVVFDSNATNLVADDTNGCFDLFVRDRSTGTTERVSVDSSGAQADDTCFRPALSADGNYVAFSSRADNLVAGDTNGWMDVFVRDRTLGTTERVSVSSTGEEANADVWGEGMSSDGRFFVYLSRASNLDPIDGTTNIDVFVHDRVTGVTQLTYVNSAGVQGNGAVSNAAISADGRHVAFSTGGDNLVDDDSNHAPDVFTHDRATGITALVSVDSAGEQADASSNFMVISSDGRFVAFESLANNLGGGAPWGVLDVFVRDRGPISGWTNYGDGFPGTVGVPSFTSRGEPALGVALELDLSNSCAAATYTVGALFVGFQPTNLPSSWGCDLLVDPVITQLVGISPWGALLHGDVPDDDSLAGMEIDLQVFELDSGAAKGISATPGLRLSLGH